MSVKLLTIVDLRP